MSVCLPSKPNVELIVDLSRLVTGDTVLPPCPAAEANSAPAGPGAQEHTGTLQ